MLIPVFKTQKVANVLNREQLTRIFFEYVAFTDRLTMYRIKEVKQELNEFLYKFTSVVKRKEYHKQLRDICTSIYGECHKKIDQVYLWVYDYYVQHSIELRNQLMTETLRSRGLVNWEGFTEVLADDAFEYSEPETETTFGIENKFDLFMVYTEHWQSRFKEIPMDTDLTDFDKLEEYDNEVIEAIKEAHSLVGFDPDAGKYFEQFLYHVVKTMSAKGGLRFGQWMITRYFYGHDSSETLENIMKRMVRTYYVPFYESRLEEPTDVFKIPNIEQMVVAISVNTKQSLFRYNPSEVNPTNVNSIVNHIKERYHQLLEKINPDSYPKFPYMRRKCEKIVTWINELYNHAIEEIQRIGQYYALPPASENASYFGTLSA